MSWQAYVDEHFIFDIEGQRLTEAAIIVHDGSVRAHSSLFPQEIDLNKNNWSALFQPYQFFESYKNFLKVDIVALDADDLRIWKGWVESRLRLMTLKVIFFLLFEFLAWIFLCYFFYFIKKYFLWNFNVYCYFYFFLSN
ncbi:hypothetical protein M5K25_008020 [Dendrobium thyrsiflorum]|uniref:Poly(A) polymerase RNA-binding domain-containing protein n=1 Tax=Dendrobium thyrsiflorum TaxID=117978 RepID=A0ABD0VEH9_DENTH